MKCQFCGLEYDEHSFHHCSQMYCTPKTAEVKALDSIADVLRDILEELKKFNEREQEKEHGTDNS